MSLGNDPERVSQGPIEHAEAVAAACEMRAQLRQDGPAPSRESILREMGRRPDGSPLPDGPTDVDPHTAARRALGGDPNR